MKEPDPSLEDRRLPIPIFSVIPLLVSLIWSFFSNSTNKVLLFGAFFLWLAGNLYSQISTGWAHDANFRATWKRGGDYDAVYWLNVAVTFLGVLLTGSGFLISLLAP